MKKTILVSSAAILSAIIVDARPQRVMQVPNTMNQCSTCHVSNQGGSLNPFGEDVDQTMSQPGPGGVANWQELFSIDSDNDGFTNGQELQDPNGEWTQGSPNPGDPNLVTAPGDANSFPSSVKEVIKGFKLIIAGGQIQLVSEGYQDLNMDVMVVNTAGRTMLTKSLDYGITSANIDIGFLSKGNYLLVIKKANTTFTRLFSK
jgi:hypothetical protein